METSKCVVFIVAAALDSVVAIGVHVVAVLAVAVVVAVAVVSCYSPFC